MAGPLPPPWPPAPTCPRCLFSGNSMQLESQLARIENGTGPPSFASFSAQSGIGVTPPAPGFLPWRWLNSAQRAGSLQPKRFRPLNLPTGLNMRAASAMLSRHLSEQRTWCACTYQLISKLSHSRAVLPTPNNDRSALTASLVLSIQSNIPSQNYSGQSILPVQPSDFPTFSRRHS